MSIEQREMNNGPDASWTAFAFRATLQGSPLRRPAWFVLQSRAQCEPQAVDWLGRHGIEAFYPVEKVWRRKPGVKRERVECDRKIAPGYVFARFEGTPLWHRIFGISLGAHYLRGVICHNSKPAAIGETQVMQMAVLPERLRELREAEVEARKIRKGDRARVREGALEGWVVDVDEVDGEMARILVPLLGKGCADVKVHRLEKVGASG